MDVARSHGRLICIINNYNYGNYLVQCLESAIGQTLPFDKIIVVDDGSEDDSPRIIQDYAQNSPALQPIFKPNAGQLSCFNAAAKFIEDTDLVFLLDADDIYPPDYVEHVCEAARREPGDFYYCVAEQFTAEQDCPDSAYLQGDVEPVVVPRSRALTLATQRWLGAQTSALVLTGQLYRQILPYAPESEWLVRADDVVVYAASILGAKKVFLRNIRVGYRLHGSNLFLGKPHWQSDEMIQIHGIKREQLFLDFSHKAGVPRVPSHGEVVNELAILDAQVKRACRLPSARKIRMQRVKAALRGMFS